MLINFLLSTILSVFALIFQFFPVSGLRDIPQVGEPVADTLTLMVEYWNSFLITFPYAVIVWHMFLYVILPFELIMLIMKFFLGSRRPMEN